MAMKQLKLAAAVGDRAAKDGGDALVFGVLPAVTAVGKVAARRLVDEVRDSAPPIVAPLLPSGDSESTANNSRHAAHHLPVPAALVVRRSCLMSLDRWQLSTVRRASKVYNPVYCPTYLRLLAVLPRGWVSRLQER